MKSPLNLREEIVNKLDMRGTIALNEEKVLGIILAGRKEGGQYRGLDLNWNPWYCRHTVYTFGTVQDMAADGRVLAGWLADVHCYHGALDSAAEGDGATETMIKIARAADIVC